MSDEFLFRGTAPALVTPFTSDDEVDTEALRELIDWQISEGVDALVVLGTTGENPTINQRERQQLVGAAVDEARGRVPVIIGTGTNSTRQSVEFTEQAASAGADGVLVVGPYYNKPTQAGFKAHVAAIAEATDCPIILYNVPGRTSFNITAETVLQLADEVPTVAGVKEASGDLAQISDILAGRPDHVAVYAGDDEIAFPVAALGGDGVISVLANALPGVFSDSIRAALHGDMSEARRLHFDLLRPMRACFYETNPLPVKAVLAEQGRMADRVRLPLVGISDEARQHVLDVFSKYLK